MTAADCAALPDCGEGSSIVCPGGPGQHHLRGVPVPRVKSKRYAHARVRRLILWAYLGLTADGLPRAAALPAVLGLTEDGRGCCAGPKSCVRCPS